jgi:hypothetical protein
MAFSDYKNIGQIQREYQITYREETYLVAPEVEPPASFVAEFEFNRENIDVFTSEAARTEAVIFPVLREVYKGYHDRFSLWIQKPVAYSDALSGTPDYLIATRSELGKTVLEKPLVVVAEAKKNDFEQGWAQCLAELVAAQKINGEPSFAVHGVVTDGKLWEFGKLVGSTFTKNAEGYTVDDLPRLFGVLHFIFQLAAAQYANLA